MKKILIITGSPRPNGNTNTLVSAFASGAVAAGHEIKIFDAAKAKMDGCHADRSCEARGACGLKDEGQIMHEYLQWADTLVLASPVYWNGFTSQIKKCIDRFYPYFFEKAKSKLTVKSACLISTCMSPTADAFDGIKADYHHLCNVLGFEDLGTFCFPGLDKANELGDHLNYLRGIIEVGYRIER